MTQYLPGPWVDPARIEPKPWLNNDGIVKLMEFPVRHAAMSRRAFHLYWQRHHSPNVMNVTAFSQFMRKYTTAHVLPSCIAGLPTQYRQSTPFEGVSEVWINNLDEVGAWLSHPLYAELIRPDEPRFIRQDGCGEFVIMKEEHLHEPTQDLVESGLTKLFVLIRRQPGLDHDVFHAAASEYGRRIMDQSALRGMLQKFTISHRLRDPLPSDLAFADIEMVSEMWFDHPDRIASLFSNSAYVQYVHPHEQSLFGASHPRVLAATIHVVHDEFSFQPTTMQPLPFNWSD